MTNADAIVQVTGMLKSIAHRLGWISDSLSMTFVEDSDAIMLRCSASGQSQSVMVSLDVIRTAKLDAEEIFLGHLEMEAPRPVVSGFDPTVILEKTKP